MNRTMVGLAAFAALLIATQLMAQERQGRRGFGRGGFNVSKAMLLQNENVQKELELVDDQKTELAKIAEDARQGRRGGGGGNFQDLSAEERAKLREEAQARQNEIDKKIDTVLLPPQRTRLNEIYVQALGSNALTNPDIAKELGIGPDLQERIADARREAMQDAFQGGGFGDLSPEERTKRMAELRTEVDKKVLALLSPDQQAKFEKMKGKKVSFELNVFGGRGGRGRRGGDN
jgi:Spy/CpxP family protein refolding chaperone